MRLLYFDCFSGAAGDMILGACLDAGLPLDALQRALGSLGVDGCDISADRVVRQGLAATKFRVHQHAVVTEAQRHTHGQSHAGDAGRPHHHTLPAIKSAVDRSALSLAGKARAKALFDRLAAAEAAVHDMPLERVHLHEVGALDSIVDIVGVVFAFEWFAAARIVVSPINVGGGMVRTSHGLYPVPAPATLHLLAGAPIYGRDIEGELLTPTGALLLTEYASEFGVMPAMRVERIGYGAGDRDLDGTPNVLRLVVGESAVETASTRVAVIECEIDDMSPQLFGALMDRLYAAGALEVVYAPVQMKKNRPGTLVTVIARPADREALIELIFAESTTIGVRHLEMRRECLDRESIEISTPLGAVRFKVATRAGRVLNAQPEFEDVARAARQHHLPIKEAQAIVTKAWLDRT